MLLKKYPFYSVPLDREIRGSPRPTGMVTWFCPLWLLSETGFMFFHISSHLEESDLFT